MRRVVLGAILRQGRGRATNQRRGTNVGRMMVAVVGGRVGPRLGQFRRTETVLAGHGAIGIARLIIKDALTSTAGHLNERV